MSFKSFITGALNTLGSAVASTGIPLVSGVGSALSAEMGKIEARDQLSKEQQFNAAQAQLNRDFQREERELTQQWNTEMWEKEKAYNTPANQLKLAMEAGINPNAVFGNGSGFVATNAPETSPMSGATASSSASLANSLLTLNPDVANLMAQTRKTDAEAKGQEIANEFQPKFNEKALVKAEEEINEIKSRIGLNDQQANEIKEMLPLLKNKTKSEINQITEQANLLIEQIAKTKSEAQSAESQADYDTWSNNFRKLYGVSPNSGLVDGIIQLAVSGEKGAKIASTMVKTLGNIAVGAFSSLSSGVGQTLSWLFNVANISENDKPTIIPAPLPE